MVRGEQSAGCPPREMPGLIVSSREVGGEAMGASDRKVGSAEYVLPP